MRSKPFLRLCVCVQSELFLRCYLNICTTTFVCVCCGVFRLHLGIHSKFLTFKTLLTYTQQFVFKTLRKYEQQSGFIIIIIIF